MTLAEKYKEMFVEGREEGRVEGRKEGRAEGKAEGLAEGEAKAQATLICSLRRNGLSISEIAKLTELPEAEISRIVESMENK